jgi:polyphosphate:AMP phosphotransferase
MGESTDEERLRPPAWRYWRALPPKGKMGIFFGSWYTKPIVDRTHRTIGREAFQRSMAEITRFEQMLCDEGALVLKFWLHLSKKAQNNRLKELKANPLTRWRVTDDDWRNFELYDRFRTVSEEALRRTSTGAAPWLVVEGTDERYRSLTVGQAILGAIRRRLDETPAGQPPPPRAAGPLPAPLVPSLDRVNLLATLDLGRKVEKKVYNKSLETLQGKLNRLVRHPRFARHSVVCVFEGSDAAGKGGAIRRVTAALDARHYAVVPIAAPTEEERAQPYLWRFWRHIPAAGRLALFDRSWYGRVLVERVEKYTAEGNWLRAYGEINDFEEQLARAGVIVVKFWLQISKEEQLRRFEERERIEFKRFKITPEDWRNREKWDEYTVASSDMVDRTSTDLAPWCVVEAEDKYHARLKILRTLTTRIEEAL